MERFYKEYYYWEDFLNGMYNDVEKSKESYFVEKSYNLLCDNELFLNTCLNLIKDWQISTNVNLTNKNSNRQAWLGQACCSYLYKSNEICTRIAWSKMTDKQRNEANKVADLIINHFELNYENKNFKLH
jgi:hypothetical protein